MSPRARLLPNRNGPPVAMDDSDLVILSVHNGIGDAFLALPCIRYFFVLGYHRVVVLATELLKRTVYAELGSIVQAIDEGLSSILAEVAEARRENRRILWCSLSSYSPLSTWELDSVALINPDVHVKLSDFVFEESTGSIRSRPMRDAYFELFGLQSVPSVVSRAPQISKDGLATAHRLIQNTCGDTRHIPVVFHMDTEPTKQWPTTNWVELGAQLQEYGCRIYLLGPPEIQSDSRFFSLRNQAWQTQVAVLASAGLFVGVDSCFGHIADALGVSGFVLFGPTSHDIWGPHGPRLRSITAPERQLRRLSVSTVARQVDALLRESIRCASPPTGDERGWIQADV